MSRPPLEEYQAKLRDLLLAASVSAADFFSLGGEHTRWQAYRRMVRSRFQEVAAHAFERLIGAIGTERFRVLVDRFLEESPLRSPYLRDVPGELLQWVESSWDRARLERELPIYGLDLLRFEWAELDTAYSYEEVRALDVVPLLMDARAVLSPAHRLLQLDFTVHRMGTDGDDAEVEPTPVRLCLYRDAKTYEVETLELTPIAFAILKGIEAEDRPLTEIVRNVGRGLGVEVDVAFVEDLSALLADLVERGVLLGSLPK